MSEVSALTQRLEMCYSGALFDVMRELGQPECVLPHAIQALDRASKVAGPAFTVSGHLERGLDAHETLLKWTEFLSAAPRGTVVVCQPNDHTIAHMGELSAETLQLRGVRGYVVDGGSRDSNFVLDIGFPVFCRYRCPRDVVGTWIPDRLGEPITIGNVSIGEGDYVFGDIDGVIVIPASIAEAVVTRAEEVMNTENLVRKAILAGVDPKTAYLEHGLF